MELSIHLTSIRKAASGGRPAARAASALCLLPSVVHLCVSSLNSECLDFVPSSCHGPRVRLWIALLAHGMVYCSVRSEQGQETAHRFLWARFLRAGPARRAQHLDFGMLTWGHSSLLPVALVFSCVWLVELLSPSEAGPVCSGRRCVPDAPRWPGPWKPLSKDLLAD